MQRPELAVGAALPDPPFELIQGGKPAGFDIELTQVIAARLDGPGASCATADRTSTTSLQGSSSGAYDCIASGTTITPERRVLTDFCDPYVVSGQSLVVDAERNADVRSTTDLGGLTIGVQQGNTSQPVAERLVAQGKAARVKVYAYGEIERALDDLTTGGCDAFMKLAPVTAWLVRDRPRLKVVQTDITREVLGICVRRGNDALRSAINEAQRALLENGSLPRLVSQWLGRGAALATSE